MGVAKNIVNLIIFLLFISQCYALTMSRADFGRALPGDKIVKNILVGADIRNNTYIMDVEGEIANWIKIAPEEVFVEAYRSKTVTLILEVPDNIRKGDYSGLIVASGKKVIGTGGEDTGTGYLLQIKSNAKITVVTDESELVIPEETYAQISIIDLEANPNEVEKGEIVNFNINLINSGTIEASGTVFLDVLDEGEVIKSFNEDIGNLGVTEEKTVNFDLDTTSLSKGDYSVYAYVKLDGSEDAPQRYGPVYFSIEDTKNESVVQYLILFGLLAAILITLFLIYKNRDGLKDMLKGSVPKKAPKIDTEIESLIYEEKEARKASELREKKLKELKKRMSSYSTTEDDHIVDYIIKNLKKGHKTKDIEDKLHEHGLSKSRINVAFRKALDEMN